MPDKTEKELLQELYQAVIGIPENPDAKGLIGQVHDLGELIVSQNNRVGKAERKISQIWGILIGIGAVGGTGLGLGIKTLVGG